MIWIGLVILMVEGGVVLAAVCATFIVVWGLKRTVNRIMTTEAQLQTTVDAIRDGVTTLITKLSNQANLIENLKQQIGMGTPVTQDQLDALGAETQGIADALRQALATPEPVAAAGTEPTAPVADNANPGTVAPVEPPVVPADAPAPVEEAPEQPPAEQPASTGSGLSIDK